MIMRMMITLTGLIVGMLGVITAIHSDHFVLGVLLIVWWYYGQFEGLPRHE